MRLHLEQVQRRTSEPPMPGPLLLIERSVATFGAVMCCLAGFVMGAIVGYYVIGGGY